MTRTEDNWDYFHCYRFNCNMLKRRCVERQGKRHRDLVGPSIEALFISFPECQDCEQGRVIRMELTPMLAWEVEI
jgi:hypothetical protein